MNKIELEQEKNAKFAEENNISQEEMDTIFKEIYEKMPSDMNEATKTLRSLRKTRGSLKRLVQSGYRMDGFILMRFRTNSYNNYAWNQVDKYVKEHGLEEAIKKGMAKGEGEYLHTKGFNKGKVIDKNYATANAIGIFQDGDKVVPREIGIGTYAMNKVLPVCKEARFTLKEGNASKIVQGTKVQYFNNAVVTDDTDAFDDETIDVYLDYVRQFFGDIIFESSADLLQYFESKNFDKNTFGVIEGECIDIGTSDDPNKNVVVNFEIGDDDADIWFTPIELAGLNIYDGAYGYLFVSAYKKKDGEINYHVGGFLPISEEVEL